MKLPAHNLIQIADHEHYIEPEFRYATRWTMVQVGDGSTNQVKLMRNVISTDLYRGQNHHFDPCWPSICRDFKRNTPRVIDLDLIDQARLLRGLALNCWFSDELAKHPMMKWAKSESIFIDSTAIAQHYGIPTAYIDASESFAIAAFFATCHYVPATTSWEPMSKGEGVLYRLQFNAINERISPICHQPFPRPSEQAAWTVELRLGEDFLCIPNLQKLHFEHDAKVGEEMLKRFDGGSKLLPLDPTARLASAMCSASEIPLNYIEEAESWLVEDPNGLPEKEVKHIRITLKEELKVDFSNTSPISYTRNELNEANQEWVKSSQKFYNDVGFRATRQLPQDNN